jgi:hypothetical protein
MHLLPDVMSPIYDEKKAPPSSFFPWFLKVPMCEIFDLCRRGGGALWGLKKLFYKFRGSFGAAKLLKFKEGFFFWAKNVFFCAAFETIC